MPQIEVQDIDGDDLDDVFVRIGFGHVLDDGFGSGEQDSVQVRGGEDLCVFNSAWLIVGLRRWRA